MIFPKFHPKNPCPKFHPCFLQGQHSVAQRLHGVATFRNRKINSVFHNIYSGYVLPPTEFQSNEASH